MHAAELDPLADKALYTLVRLTPMAADTEDARRVHALLDRALACADDLAPKIRASCISPSPRRTRTRASRTRRSRR